MWLPALLLAFCHAGKVGLNSGAENDLSTVPIIVASQAEYVRINFRLQTGWSGASDPKFQKFYDGLVGAYVSSGTKVYGLLGAETVPGGYDRNNPSAFMDPFVQACSAVIQRYQNQVKLFELFNEPNDWAGGSDAQMTPYWFSVLLAKVYEQKYNNKWTAQLVSGPLFSFDGTTASDYLYATYEAGCTQGAWDWFHQNAKTYPLDGIGYHVYVAQGTSDPQQVTTAFNKNLDDLWDNGIRKGENYRGLEPQTSKQIYVSEFSWPSDATGEPGQAANLKLTYQSIFAPNPHVAVGFWFTWQDFSSSQLWGLRRNDGSTKPSWDVFRALNGTK